MEKVIKRNRKQVPFDAEKIKIALRKANADVPKKHRLTEDEILMAFVNQYDNKSDDDPSRQEEIKKAISHPANSTTDHPNLPNNDQSYHSN